MENRKGRKVYIGPKGGQYILKDSTKIYIRKTSKLLQPCGPHKYLFKPTGRCRLLHKQRDRKQRIGDNTNAAFEILRKEIIPGYRGQLKHIFK